MERVTLCALVLRKLLLLPGQAAVSPFHPSRLDHLIMWSLILATVAFFVLLVVFS